MSDNKTLAPKERVMSAPDWFCESCEWDHWITCRECYKRLKAKNEGLEKAIESWKREELFWKETEKENERLVKADRHNSQEWAEAAQSYEKELNRRGQEIMELRATVEMLRAALKSHRRVIDNQDIELDSLKSVKKHCSYCGSMLWTIEVENETL